MRILVRAEAGLYRAEATRRAISAGWAAGLIFGALALLQAAAVALLIGLILALAPAWGLGWAVAAVTVAALVIAGFMIWLGLRWIGDAIDPGNEATE